MNIKLFGISKTKSIMIIKIIVGYIVEKPGFLIILTVILTYLTLFTCIKMSEKLSIIGDWLDVDPRKNIL